MSLIDLVRQINDASHCERDGFPIVLIDGEPRCSVEYADGLIGGEKVIGVAEGEHGVEILFANRRSIPLTKPASGEPLVARSGMLPELRALLIGRTLEGFRHGEWVGDGSPPERRPIFGLQFSGEESREHRTIEVSLESVKRIGAGLKAT
ncbi:hypothetical protein BH23CHL2_BH23CHL2_34230 [soil metagenome]